MQFLRFAWWNVESLAHYDAARASMSRWPGSQAEFAVHFDRIANGLHELRRLTAPDFVGLAEVMQEKATELPTTCRFAGVSSSPRRKSHE